MRASVRAEYGIDLRSAREMPMLDFSDLVAWLPPGAALWRSFGGPASMSDESALLRAVDFSVRVLDYHAGRHGKGKKPEAPKPPQFARERREQEQRAIRKAQSRVRMRGKIPRGRPV